jgi:hypothetical protein
MTDISQPGRGIREADNPDDFERVVTGGREPAVLRRAVPDWQLVRAAGEGEDTVTAYLRERDTGLAVYTVVGQPQINGRFGFSDDFAGLNFQARQTPLAGVLPHLDRAIASGTAIAIQAAPALELLRHWREENPMPLLPDSVAPTLWLSTPARVAPHSDIHDNIACVAAGRRRFTLFPPEQIRNLYLGPLLDAPGGVPVTSANLWDPDFERHPRFAEALASASEATLEPGDAIFIPALWWHAVESLAPLNILVNYWWGGTAAQEISPYNALCHAALAISELPAEKRRQWQHYFNALVFRLEEPPGAHLPSHLADLITTPDEQQVANLMAHLARSLQR